MKKKTNYSVRAVLSSILYDESEFSRITNYLIQPKMKHFDN